MKISKETQASIAKSIDQSQPTGSGNNHYAVYCKIGRCKYMLWKTIAFWTMYNWIVMLHRTLFLIQIIVPFNCWN